MREYQVEKVAGSPILLARVVDHTWLKTEADFAGAASPRKAYEADRQAFLEGTVDLAERGVVPYSLCVNPGDVAHVRGFIEGEPLLYGATDVIAVAGFPNPLDYSIPEIIVEAQRAIVDGASEIDVVLPYQLVQGMGPEGLDQAMSHIRYVGNALALQDNRVPVKLIGETATLSPEEVIWFVGAAHDAGYDFVKTSTGKHSAGGATEEALDQMGRSIHALGSDMGIKISGGANKGNIGTLLEAAMGSQTMTLDPMLVRVGASSLLPSFFAQQKGDY